MRVTLLGTGSPVPSDTRYGMSTLVQAGGFNLVFDAGRGVPIEYPDERFDCLTDHG